MRGANRVNFTESETRFRRETGFPNGGAGHCRRRCRAMGCSDGAVCKDGVECDADAVCCASVATGTMPHPKRLTVAAAVMGCHELTDLNRL
jgi:hypothetical protein